VKVRYLTLILLCLLLLHPLSAEGESGDKRENLSAISVPILLYHRFGPVVTDSMTVTTKVFEWQMKYLKDNGYSVIPLRRLVDYYSRKGPPPPPRSVVIAADDGHKSVYTDMFPFVKKYRFPVTLFIYPSAISNASYAMTWDQLREIIKSGFMDVQSHAYWHPNFKKEKKRLKPDRYEKFVEIQLKKSAQKLEKELGVHVDMLAWPFGIYDDQLVLKAREAGYIAAFTIERRNATGADNIMKLPRYIMVDADRGGTFERLLSGNPVPRKIVY